MRFQNFIVSSALGFALLITQAHAAAPKCAQSACVDTRSFVASVTGFRASKQGSRRVLTATVRFENKTAKPLTLGYVSASGVALDELGNRYEVPGANGVRAIGEINGQNFDPKFTLAPGEGADARFELSWEPGKAKAGSSYELDLAIREITPSGAEQFKLGAEHALHFASLGQSTAATPAAAATATAPAAPADPCGGSARCFNAGTFVAEVMQVQSSAMTAGARHQSVSINIRFRNISDKPLILGYRSASSAALDNFGNGFTWGRPGTHDTSVKGIGMVTARSADTQFALSPGQSRNATFGIIRFNATPPIGDRWNYDVVIEEVEIQPGQVVKSVRQNSLSFPNLSAGTFAAASGGAAAAVGAALGSETPPDANAVASKLIDLFERKTSKKKK
ncbi:MAG TPA: hypothetical protein VFP37_05280 [Steroidobacteraceae bacterium]|nr:hypothetical protein [Steroidobacteraceae bacterium]